MGMLSKNSKVLGQVTKIMSIDSAIEEKHLFSDHSKGIGIISNYFRQKFRSEKLPLNQKVF